MKVSLSDVAKKTLPRKAVEHLTQFISNQVYSCLIHASVKERSPGLHVSALLPDCMRKSGYNILLGSSMDMRGIYKTGIGTHLHNSLKILEVQELPLEWEGIVTDGIDEYSPDLGIFLDKKITWGPPKYDMWENHKRQLGYYKTMLINNDYNATHGFILYFDMSKPRFHVRYASGLRAVKSLGREMLKKRDILVQCRRTGKLPDRTIGSDCYICGRARECLGAVL